VCEFLIHARKIDDFSSPFYVAAAYGKLSVCKLLLKLGAQLKDSPRHPLHGAAFHGHEDVCKLLIESQAPINSIDEYSSSALNLAALGRSPLICKLLIKHNANPNINLTSSGTSNALFLMVSQGNDKICNLLIKAGATMGNGQLELLSLAALLNYPRVCKVLINAGAGSNKAADYLRTLELLKINNMQKLSELFIEKIITILDEGQKNRVYTLLNCIRLNSHDEINCAYTRCILDVLIPYIRSIMRSENMPKIRAMIGELRDSEFKQNLIVKYL
jgi:ankyrin repeat protein